MMDLLMLGIIPGTDIQIDFQSWLTASTILAVCLLLVIAFKKRHAIVAACNPAWRFASCRFWLLVLRIQLAWQLRKTATLL